MSLGLSEDQKKIAAVAAFVVIASGLFYYEYFYTPATPSPASVASVSEASEGNASAATSDKAAKKVGTSASLDPTLHMEAMLVSESVEYTGSGRNIFSANSAPAIPIPAGPARPQATAHTEPPPPPVPAGPAPPPVIPLKYFGVETASNGKRQAFLLHDDDVYMASAGDVVMRRYRVISVDPKSIQMEDMQANDKQTLPLLAN